MNLASYTNLQLIENNLDSIIVTNQKCEIEYANKVAIQLHGYTLNELLGKHISIFDVPGKELPAEAFAILVKTGKWAGEAVRRKKDGTFFQASISIFSIFDEQGALVGFAGNTKDISKITASQEALMEKQSQLISIVDNTEDVIVSIDRNLRVVEFNQVLAKFVKRGFNYDLKKGDRMLDYIDPKKHDHLKSIYARVFKGERVFDIEIFDSVTGHSIYFESSYNPILNEHNEVKGISIFSKNITDRVKNEKALQKALEEKGILLSEIHHRLKNNLAIISSILQLQELNITNKEAIKALKESRMRIKSTALLHEMLYQNDSIDTICIKQYLTKLFNDINNSMGNNLYKLSIEGEDASLKLHNAVPAGLLFNELFTNSIKHGFDGKSEGEISIKIDNNEKKTVFTVTEHESSFPEELNFENAASTGISLIKTFAEQLNGGVKLEKKPSTKFILDLDLS